MPASTRVSDIELSTLALARLRGGQRGLEPVDNTLVNRGTNPDPNDPFSVTAADP